MQDIKNKIQPGTNRQYMRISKMSFQIFYKQVLKGNSLNQF